MESFSGFHRALLALKSPSLLLSSLSPPNKCTLVFPGITGFDWPSAETWIWDAEPELRLGLCFTSIPSQPKGNCCHVPGLTLQLHLLSAEQHSGFGSKRLLDLAEAPLRNLLTSEMLSYGAEVMEKSSRTFTIFFAHHLRFPAPLICGLSVGLFLSHFNGQSPRFGPGRGVPGGWNACGSVVSWLNGFLVCMEKRSNQEFAITDPASSCYNIPPQKPRV